MSIKMLVLSLTGQCNFVCRYCYAAEHEIPWLHVRNAGQEDLTVVYAVKGFPTKIVIDPQGKITRVVVGEDPAFYTYLDSLFKL